MIRVEWGGGRGEGVKGQGPKRKVGRNEMAGEKGERSWEKVTGKEKNIEKRKKRGRR